MREGSISIILLPIRSKIASIFLKASRVDTDSRNQVEAARYALLRRLAPAFHHRIVGGLHPIELIAESIERRLQTDLPDLANSTENLRKIKNLCRSAVLSCTSVTSWLAPQDGAVTMLGEGIDECVVLLNTDFGMRGFRIRNESGEIGVDVSSSALRSVLTAPLIAAADNAQLPADLVLTTEVFPGYALVSIRVCAADRAAGVAAATN
jgi:C4-dicarboxylate-specific signal transduction histidine kinase